VASERSYAYYVQPQLDNSGGDAHGEFRPSTART
jgi:hypothetical protein